MTAIDWADKAQLERRHLCGELEMKICLHQESYARSCRKIEELKKHYQEDNAVRQRKLEEFPTQHNQESRTESYLWDKVRRLQERFEFIEDWKIFHDPDSPSSSGSDHVPHQALITSSSRKPTCEFRVHRNTREDMCIPGNVFDCPPARRDPDEVHNEPRIWATSSGVLRREGIEKSESGDPLQSIPLPCFQRRVRQRSLDGGNYPMSMTNNHAVGIATCTQSGMSIPSYLSSEIHLGQFPGHTEFQKLDCEFPNGSLREGEKSYSGITVDQGNRNSQIAGRLHHAKINNGQRSPRL